ncbi:MAG: ABC transporter ATP-binding protein [Chlamydiales bacterium]|nr:ABC transporter ATP-binding protein [Chlamydiales bacterium]
MRLILEAAMRAKSQFLLFVMTFVTLLFFTIANQVEMVSLGVISNTGADFFALFGNQQDKKPLQEQKITLHEVEGKWNQIAGSNTSPITKTKISEYLAKNDNNLLNRLFQEFRSKFYGHGAKLEAVVVLLLCVAAFKALFLFLSRYTTQLLAIRISRDLRQQYFEHIQTLPMSFYQKYNIGALSSRVAGDSAQIATSINSCITNYLHTPFTIVTTLGVCFYVSWKLSIVIFFGLPSIILPVLLITKKVKQITRQFLKNQEHFTSVLIDFLAGIQTVKIFSMENFSLKKYKEQNDQIAFLQSKTAKYDLLVRPILHTITTFCLAFVVISGLYFFHMSVSELIVFCGFLYMFYEPVKKFADENTNIQKGVVAAERLFEVLQIQPQVDRNENALDITEFNQSIDFDNVWFKYEDKWVLRGVSFTIAKGETVAIVGATGSGKSTILQLFPRLYEVQKGEIRIDGKSILDYSQASIRNIISYVSQKPFLFFDTVAANIAYGKPITQDDIINAAKKAHAHEFIMDLNHQYDTHLAETGKNLSGGQQQRLSIARALAKKSPILILDEATSSLDAISEEKIKTAIKELHGQITQIIVAHRLSTIEHADKIIFIQDGEKIAEGTKDELLKNCAQFKLMWDLNFRRNQTPQEDILAH